MANARSAAEELRLAEQCDARGAHDDAINALARAVRLGDVEATTRLGKRLTVGHSAPLLPRQGARFLVDAFNQGGAEAGARLAVLAAAGAYVEQNLGEALKLLMTAAQRGWQPAQSQLIALAGDGELAAAAARAPNVKDTWRRVAASVDLEAWLSAPGPTTLHESPLIRAFEALIPARVCRWLIDRSAGRLQRALVYDAVGGREHASETRTNTCAQFDLMSSDLIHLLVQLRMQAACGLPLCQMEAPAVLHYAPGEEITDHFDFVNPKIPNYAQELAKNGQRVLTFLIYLNDDYEGGETAFPEINVVHKGRCGDGLFFVNALANDEPDLRTLHAGRPPTRGEKWIVSQFVRSRRVLGLVPELG